VTFPPLPQPKLVLDLATPEGCKAEADVCNIAQPYQQKLTSKLLLHITCVVTSTYTIASLVIEYSDVILFKHR